MPDEGGVFPEWEEKTLGECMTLIASKGYKGKDLVNDEDKAIMFSPSDIDTFGDVSLVKNAHISDELFKKSKEALVKNGDILFTKTASIGKVGYVKNLDHNATINPQIVILRANENVDSYFLFCAIRTESFKKQVRKISGGTTIKTMSQEALKELKIKIPKSIEEQRKIVAALAAYDEMIAVKTAKLETWQECKKRMVKEIFGRTKRFKNDDGREFPEWEEKTLGEVAEINPASAESLPETFYYMDLGSIDSGIWIEKRLIDKKSAPSRAQRIAHQDDVFFQSVRPLNKDHYHYTKKADKSVVASTGFIQLRIKNGSNAFLYQLLYENNFNNEVKKYITGSNYPAINTTNLSKIKVMLPCMEEQQKIGSFLAEIDKEIQIEKEFIRTYTEGKKRMMKNLME
ncbi:restriction endonuclease subunit S [Blautia massiliensis (ex Durand et al. 2017)]|uniref:restriction endonuclease subunit S n=1 Tax=Blautia massiliensis (ex Durand et al. 2017) TaxID=1737424 RepID=UPI00189E8CA7